MASALSSHRRPKKQRSNTKLGFLRRFLAPKESSAKQSTQADPLVQHASTPSKRNANAIGSQISDSAPLTQEDLRKLFSGAPQFLIERGEQSNMFPQVWFPYDSDNETSDLNDRLHLQHESFAAVTLHAHLPIYKRLKGLGEGGKNANVQQKRARFDSGVYELPNMLSLQGTELGTVGFRYFMEMPITDALKLPDAARVPMSSSGEGLVDRRKLISEGPKAWKRIGIRAVKLDHIANRLHQLTLAHDEILRKGPQSTILDVESSGDLYHMLFDTFLYAPSKLPSREASDPFSLKVQVESLVKVLASRNAWFNFRHVDWRIRLGQLLWEDPAALVQTEYHIHQSVAMVKAERKWLLLQILLSMELLVRIDAIIKLAIDEPSPELDVTVEEIEIFNRLRTRKVDWDIILARVFFDEIRIEVEKRATPSARPSNNANGKSAQSQNNRLLSVLKQRSDSNHKDALDGDLDCVLLPRHAELQIEGLLHFAREIAWPNESQLTSQLLEKFGRSAGGAASPRDSAYATPLQAPTSVRKGYFDYVRPCIVTRPEFCQKLRPSFGAAGTGGWLSRSWLTGLVLPGEPAGHFLFSAIIENDPDALSRLGDCANLYGGFVYEGRSWFSKACVLGRVIACRKDVRECLGWIYCPVVPVDVQEKPVREGWFEVDAKQLSRRERPRIKDNYTVSAESSITGTGTGFTLGENFTLPLDKKPFPNRSAEFNGLVFESQMAIETSKELGAIAYKVSMSFTLTPERVDPTKPAAGSQSISLGLYYDVYFVTAFPCRPPRGYAARSTSVDSTSHQGENRMPGHLLHTSFVYACKNLSHLYGAVPPAKSRTNKEVWVIDARGGRDNEVFARAWCAQVGQNAIVSRVRRTCLSCSIREARALDIAIVIRV